MITTLVHMNHIKSNNNNTHHHHPHHHDDDDDDDLAQRVMRAVCV
jgi:hypothetical protein